MTPPTKILGLIIAAGLLTSCATVFSGSTQELTFISNPDGATVIINGKQIGKTPVTTSLKKQSGQTLVFNKDGYKPFSLRLETRINGWFWGNILGDGIGSTTDAIAGNVYEYSPSQYMVTLQPDGTTRVDSQTALPEKQKAKEFIVISYKEIITDLGKGEGEYLKSLLGTLKVSESDRAGAIKKIRALSEVYTNIPEFADQVINLFIK